MTNVAVACITARVHGTVTRSAGPLWLSSIQCVRRCTHLLTAVLLLPLSVGALAAQQDQITSIDMAVGRAWPVTVDGAITRVSVANPEIADVVVVSTLELVVNAKAPGETDAIVWEESGVRKHFRVAVRTSAERQQIVVGIKFAEVDRNFLRDLGASGLYQDSHNQIGTGQFETGAPTGPNGTTIIPNTGDFISVLTDFDTHHLLGFLSSQEQRGRARMLAEPTVMAGNKEEANFLAGGEVPVPVVQTGGGSTAGGGAPVTIQYKEYGVRLHFIGEILSDTLLRLNLRPEVSSLDFTNAITLSGFRIPALTTRRVESTVDVRRGESLIISGMFNDVWSRSKTGVPIFMSIPIIGQLFSSTQWQHNQTELLIVVTPLVINPAAPPPQNLVPLAPDTTLPARDAIKRRLLPAGQPPTMPPRP
jgi:Flp pilus assembly secretin CpaC